MTRRRNPKGQGERLRDDLLEAAASVLGETGDERGLSMREVARRAGVTPPSVYLHFDDRDDLVAAVVVDRFARLGRAIGVAVAAAPDDAAARLRAGCRAYVRLGLQDPGTYRVLFGGDTATQLEDEARELTMGPFHALADGIGAAQTAGVVRDGDPFRLATHVWATLHGLVALRRSRPAFPWAAADELVDEALAMLLDLAPTRVSASRGRDPTSR